MIKKVTERKNNPNLPMIKKVIERKNNPNLPMIKKRIKPKKHSNQKWQIITLIILIITIGFVLNVFFSYRICNDWNCFNSNLEKCNRAKFIGESNGLVFEYIILGRSDDTCRVNIELLQGELNNQDSIKLENQKMVCSLPLGIATTPESDIGNCHGLLKEGLQDLIIKKLYTYLVQNLGRINLEVLDVPKIN
ncbi:MAG: hypothetical protein U9Q73_03270 [Nanoarchaeota archaeon]|nr:hypothetical protein [Nanoarchaeota archaeon]